MDRPFVVALRAFVRPDRTLVLVRVHQGSGAHGSPLWSTGISVPLRLDSLSSVPPEHAARYVLSELATSTEGRVVSPEIQAAYIRTWRRKE